jgi:hypothetical protein
MGGPRLLPGHEPRIVLLRDLVVLLVQLEDRRRKIVVRPAASGDYVQVDLPAVAASIADDDRFIAIVMIVAMIALSRLARRFVPALRPNAR